MWEPLFMRLDQRTCYGSQTGPMTWICVKTQDSLLLLGCLEARKEANQRTVYGAAKRTGIKTNHRLKWNSISSRDGIKLRRAEVGHDNHGNRPYGRRSLFAKNEATLLQELYERDVLAEPGSGQTLDRREHTDVRESQNTSHVWFSPEVGLLLPHCITSHLPMTKMKRP
jgi:hypothetical protein